MNFLRNLLASIIGFFVAIFLIVLFFIAIGSAIGSAMGSGEKIVVEPNTVLELDLALTIKDYAPKENNPLADALDLPTENLGLNAVLNAIENAKTDANIKGISIKTLFVNAGMAQTQAIRNKLKDFKESGKLIYAYNDVYDQKNYYLSSVADAVYLNPVGAIDFKGLSTEILYFKDFEDKYGVKMEVIRHGKYKSAVEPYLTNKMSEANREQTVSFLKSIWSEIITDISEDRGMSIESLNAIADNAYGRDATLALEHKLIDAVIYEDEYETKLNESIDASEASVISLEDYIASGKGRIKATSKDRIAVIYAQGQIMYGKGNEDIIGQGLINEAIKKAVKDKKTKAIVLRVNSPGGSALASELIWRELELAKKEKPLVVSMGNYAASGGYYIAAGADKIVAEPTTITGSIGVFGMLPNAYEFAKDIGINAEQVSTNNNPDYSFFEPMDKRFYEVTKEGVEHIYDTFVSRVAAGREMSTTAVNEIAQGRVWTGKEAKEVGLVDELGGLQEAINIAADLAEIGDYRIRNYPNYKKDFKDSFGVFPFAKVDKEAIIKETLGDEEYRLYKRINDMKNLKGIQARMPYVFTVK